MDEGGVAIALVIGMVLGFACAVGAGFIANAKGRSAAGYFILGLFLPILGLIIAAAVPRLDETHPGGPVRVSTSFLNISLPSEPTLERGMISVSANEVLFQPRGDGPSWSVPLSEVSSINVMNNASLPNDVPLRESLLRNGKLVPAIDQQKQGTPFTYYFSGTAGGIKNLAKRRLEPARSAAETTKKCPHCAETIKAEATKCRFCGSDLTTQGER